MSHRESCHLIECISDMDLHHQIISIICQMEFKQRFRNDDKTLVPTHHLLTHPTTARFPQTVDIYVKFLWVFQNVLLMKNTIVMQIHLH